jgi:pyruvate/2-oxoglutarate dehydrogenase complex dihydrolipoamide acyltransferase (E2) component
VHKAPVVVNDKLVVREVVHFNLSIDHRFVDGGRAKMLNTIMLDAVQNPEKYFS